VSPLPFRQQAAAPRLPAHYRLQTAPDPSGESINALLISCGEPAHPVERWPLALSRSLWQLSIIDERDQALVGFIRATSDLALNANLWNLAASPGDDQNALLNVLLHHSLARLKKELPGCSVSISAPAIALEGLKKQGFILDPGGIRTMGLRLR
jgi:hypothetical protein